MRKILVAVMLCLQSAETRAQDTGRILVGVEDLRRLTRDNSMQLRAKEQSIHIAQLRTEVAKEAQRPENPLRPMQASLVRSQF